MLLVDASRSGTLDMVFQMPYNYNVTKQGIMQDEFLTRCVVDPIKRTIYIYSNEGDSKEVVCETVDEFMNVLGVIRNSCPPDALVYTDPLEVQMEVFTIEEWEKNFDELFKRVEEGETIGIIKEDGQAAVMMPADDEIVRIYTEQNNEAQ